MVKNVNNMIKFWAYSTKFIKSSETICFYLWMKTNLQMGTERQRLFIDSVCYISIKLEVGSNTSVVIEN